MKPNEKGNGAVLYIRVSCDGQTKGELILATQEKLCRDYCSQNGLTVIAVFIEPGESAPTADRPEFQKMLAFCKIHRHEVGYVVVQDLSRFARIVLDQGVAIKQLREIDVLVRSTHVSKRNFSPHFPLRHLGVCDLCGTPLTGAFCHGRTKSYAYYWCCNSVCPAVRVFIRLLNVKNGACENETK